MKFLIGFFGTQRIQKKKGQQIDGERVTKKMKQNRDHFARK